MIVANPTTPANFFHLLRRQVAWPFRKPCVVFSPKSLLRHPAVISPIKDFTAGSFNEVLDDPTASAKDVKRVVLCSGKVYYDLYEEREKRGIDDVYLLRVEQLYPFPARALIHELSRFKESEMVWCQEEPKNMGAWSFIEPNLEWVLEHIQAKHRRPRYVGRPSSAATATGLMSKHQRELKAFLDEALS